MTVYTDFYIDKISGSYADTLVCFGLARIINELLYRSESKDRDVRIQDRGAYYIVGCRPGLTTEIISHHSAQIAPAKYILKTDAEVPSELTGKYHLIVNYSHEKAKFDAYREYLSGLKGKKRDEVEIPTEILPHIHWETYSAINSKDFSAITTYNKLVVWWSLINQDLDALCILFDLYASHPNDLSKAIADWEAIDRQKSWGIPAKATALQIYNPDSGKGLNTLKADGSKLEGDQLKAFWMTEFLKVVGFYEAAIHRVIKGKDRDRKTFVINPRDISFASHTRVMSEFVKAMPFESHIRFDILAIIHYSKSLLKYFVEPKLPEHFQQRMNIKTTLISGFFTAYHKNLGGAVATLNVSHIALPGWIEIRTSEDVYIHLELLEELQKLVTSLKEDHSDTHELLQRLRDFISGDDLKMFLRFSTLYAAYYLRERERNPYLRTLSTEFVERIITIMGKKFSSIADRTKYPGFHNIAAAIATSTVWAQNDKVNNRNPTHEIRYGLHRELARQAHSPEAFLKALGEFIRSYNNETMRAKELNRCPKCSLIDPEDISDILRMIDEYQDAQMIAEILLAYGSGFMKFSHSKFAQQENAS